MKIKTLILSFSSLAIVATPTITLSSCSNVEQKITKITVSAHDSIMKVGQSTQLTAKVEPTSAKNKEVTWKVSNSEYGTITSAGLFTATKLGSVEITATANDGSGISGSTSIQIVDTETETAEDYIFDRTFVLWGDGEKPCRGTGWILADATPNNPDDYVYWVATNWHVQQGLKKTGGWPNKMFFSCSKTDGIATLPSEYVAFGPNNYLAEDDENFYLDGTSTISIYGNDYVTKEYIKRTGLKGIDLHIAKANFEMILESQETEPSKTAKAKLDKLNKLTKAGKPINQFADKTTDSTHFEDKDLYVAGYPVNPDDKKSYWEYHDMKSEGIPFGYYPNKDIPEKGSHAHWTENDVESPLMDCAPQYTCSQLVIKATDKWLGGGASGSMLIGNFGSSLVPIWKVCGIYWGGWGDSTGQYFIPSFSILNSDYKDFISEYIEQKA